jgi:deoxyhypusine monooxygenase
MTSRYWFATTLVLAAALLAAVLLLPPGSPPSIMSQSQPEFVAPALEPPEESPQALADQGRPTLDALIQATEDPAWKVRWDAVNTLGELGKPQANPALVRRALYDDNPHPRWRSLWALSAIDSSGVEAIPLLRRGLEDPDPVVVRNAAVALAFFKQPEARPELLQGLQDPDEWRRWEAVFSLKNIGDQEVAEALSRLLNAEVEPAVRVRQEAALTLGRVGGDGVIAALLDALRNDLSAQVRWRAALALSWLGDPSVVTSLDEALSTEQDTFVRESIEKAIAKLQEG